MKRSGPMGGFAKGIPRKASCSQVDRYSPAYVPLMVFTIGLDELRIAWADEAVRRQ